MIRIWELWRRKSEEKARPTLSANRVNNLAGFLRGGPDRLNNRSGPPNKPP